MTPACRIRGGGGCSWHYDLVMPCSDSTMSRTRAASTRPCVTCGPVPRVQLRWRHSPISGPLAKTRRMHAVDHPHVTLRLARTPLTLLQTQEPCGKFRFNCHGNSCVSVVSCVTLVILTRYQPPFAGIMTVNWIDQSLRVVESSHPFVSVRGLGRALTIIPPSSVHIKLI